MKNISEDWASVSGCTVVPLTKIGKSMQAPCLCVVGLKIKEILELKNSLKEIQNTFENFKNRLNQAEGTNSELKDESFEII